MFSDTILTKFNNDKRALKKTQSTKITTPADETGLSGIHLVPPPSLIRVNMEGNRVDTRTSDTTSKKKNTFTTNPITSKTTTSEIEGSPTTTIKSTGSYVDMTSPATTTNNNNNNNNNNSSYEMRDGRSKASNHCGPYEKQ